MKSLSIITRSDFKEYIPFSLSLMVPWRLNQLEKNLPRSFPIETLVGVIAGNVDGDSGFLPDLARLELIIHYLKLNQQTVSETGRMSAKDIQLKLDEKMNDPKA